MKAVHGTKFFGISPVSDVENPPRYSGYSLDRLFPDQLFPPDSKQSKLTASLARDLLGQMLVIDPEKHPEVNATAPGQYNHIVDEREYTVDQWKELIFYDVIEYELDQIKKYVNEDKQSINQLMDQSVDQPME